MIRIVTVPCVMVNIEASLYINGIRKDTKATNNQSRRNLKGRDIVTLSIYWAIGNTIQYLSMSYGIIQ
jgi:hypothetical protein